MSALAGHETTASTVGRRGRPLKYADEAARTLDMLLSRTAWSLPGSGLRHAEASDARGGRPAGQSVRGVDLAPRPESGREGEDVSIALPKPHENPQFIQHSAATPDWQLTWRNPLYGAC